MQQEKNNVIKTLSELSTFILSVMKEFEWYFIKVYLFQRKKMCLMLSEQAINWKKTQKNTDYIVRHHFEKNRMNPFLDHLSLLTETKGERVQPIYPQENICLDELFHFLEIRISAMVNTSMVLNRLHHLKTRKSNKRCSNKRSAAITHVSLLFSRGAKDISVKMALVAHRLALNLADFKNKLQQNSKDITLLKRELRYHFSAPLHLLEHIKHAENTTFVITSNLTLQGCHFNQSFIFGSARQKNKSLILDGCTGIITLNKHDSLRLTIKNSPLLKLKVLSSTISNAHIIGETEELVIQSCLAKKIDIRGTVKKLSLMQGSVVSALTITSSIVGTVAIDESRAAVQLSTSPIIHEIVLTNNALAQINSDKSRINKLQSDNFIYATLTQSVLAELECQTCDFTYLYFGLDSKLLDKKFDYPTGAVQLVKKNGTPLAFYSSDQLMAKKNIDDELNITDQELKADLIKRMYLCLSHCSTEFLLKHTNTLIQPNSDAHYQKEKYTKLKNRLLSSVIPKLGITLLKNHIDPSQSIWENICISYSNLNKFATHGFSPNKLIELEFIQCMKKWQESYYTEHTQQLNQMDVRTKLFLIMNSDNAIREHTHDHGFKQLYLKDKQNLFILFKIIQYIHLYHPTKHFRSDKKQLLKYRLLIMIEQLNTIDTSNIQLKFNEFYNRLEDLKLLYDDILRHGIMMRLIFKLIESLIKEKKKKDMLSRNTKTLLDMELEKHKEKKWASQLKTNLLIRLSELPEAEALVATLKEIDGIKPAFDKSPLFNFKQRLSKSKICQELRESQSNTKKYLAALNTCKLYCDHYMPVFKHSGSGKKKWECMQYLSQFISSETKNPLQRLESLRKKIDYLTQTVTETNADSRNVILLRSMPVWQGRSRKHRGYEFMLAQIGKALNDGLSTELNKNKVVVDSILQSRTTQNLLQGCQEDFFKGVDSLSAVVNNAKNKIKNITASQFTMTEEYKCSAAI